MVERFTIFYWKNYSKFKISVRPMKLQSLLLAKHTLKTRPEIIESRSIGQIPEKGDEITFSLTLGTPFSDLHAHQKRLRKQPGMNNKQHPNGPQMRCTSRYVFSLILLRPHYEGTALSFPSTKDRHRGKSLCTSTSRLVWLQCWFIKQIRKLEDGNGFFFGYNGRTHTVFCSELLFGSRETEKKEREDTMSHSSEVRGIIKQKCARGYVYAHSQMNN